MLQLNRAHAALMHVAKGALPEIEDIVTRLKAALAASEGRVSLREVPDAELAKQLAQLLDLLHGQGLPQTSAQDILGHLHVEGAYAARHRTPMPSPLTCLIGGYFAALRVAPIRKIAGGPLLVDWRSELPPDLEAQAFALYEQSRPRAAAAA